MRWHLCLSQPSSRTPQVKRSCVVSGLVKNTKLNSKSEAGLPWATWGRLVLHRGSEDTKPSTRTCRRVFSIAYEAGEAHPFRAWVCRNKKLKILNLGEKGGPSATAAAMAELAEHDDDPFLNRARAEGNAAGGGAEDSDSEVRVCSG